MISWLNDNGLSVAWTTGTKTLKKYICLHNARRWNFAIPPAASYLHVPKTSRLTNSNSRGWIIGFFGLSQSAVVRSVWRVLVSYVAIRFVGRVGREVEVLNLTSSPNEDGRQLLSVAWHPCTLGGVVANLASFPVRTHESMKHWRRQSHSRKVFGGQFAFGNWVWRTFKRSWLLKSKLFMSEPNILYTSPQLWTHIPECERGG